jgi:hypothetical protein
MIKCTSYLNQLNDEHIKNMDKEKSEVGSVKIDSCLIEKSNLVFLIYDELMICLITCFGKYPKFMLNGYVGEDFLFE